MKRQRNIGDIFSKLKKDIGKMREGMMDRISVLGKEILLSAIIAFFTAFIVSEAEGRMKLTNQALIIFSNENATVGYTATSGTVTNQVYEFGIVPQASILTQQTIDITNYSIVKLTNNGSITDSYALTAQNKDGYQTIVYDSLTNTVMGTSIVLNPETSAEYVIATIRTGVVTNTTISTTEIMFNSIGYTNGYDITNRYSIDIRPQIPVEFIISHDKRGSVGIWENIEIRVIDSASNTVEGFTGKITLTVTGSTDAATYVNWQNTAFNNGTLNNDTPAAGEGEYIFNVGAGDRGIITVQVRDDTQESVNINIRSGTLADSDAEGYLMFEYDNPYIVSIVPERNGISSVNSSTSVLISFSREMNFASMAGEITVNEIYYDPYSHASAVTNVLGISIISNSPTEARISMPIGITNLFMRYEISISTNNIVGTNGLKLMNNPYNTNFNQPYEGYFIAGVDPAIGAVISTNLEGAVIPGGVALEILPGSFIDNAYVRIDQESSANTAEGDARLDYEEYADELNGAVRYRVSGTYNGGSDITDLNGVSRIRMYYSDIDGDGYVDSDPEISENNLAIYKYNEIENRWDYVSEGRVNTVSNYVETDIKEFGIYRLVESTTAKIFGESFLLYPNPFDPNGGRVYIKFFMEMDGHVDIKVYTVSGRIVKTIKEGEYLSGPHLYEREFTWDGRNGYGEIVVNGIYVIKVIRAYTDGSRETRIEKIGVLRK
jgi:hypothetical protein